MNIECSNAVVILGKRDSGKTFLIKTLMHLLPYRFTVIDITGDFKGFQFKGDYWLVDINDRLIVENHLLDVWSEPNQMLVIDEADRFPYHKTTLSKIINLGRHQNIGYIASARRTANIHKDILSNADYAFIFRHVLPSDLSYLNRWFPNTSEKEIRSLQDYEFLVMQKGSPTLKAKVYP